MQEKLEQFAKQLQQIKMQLVCDDDFAEPDSILCPMAKLEFTQALAFMDLAISALDKTTLHQTRAIAEAQMKGIY